MYPRPTLIDKARLRMAGIHCGIHAHGTPAVPEIPGAQVQGLQIPVVQAAAPAEKAIKLKEIVTGERGVLRSHG